VYTGLVPISADQCAVLHSVASDIEFFCNSCVSKLPAALDSYDNQTYFESCMSSLEDKVNELQAAEKQLHESVKNIESQLKEYQSSIANVDGNQPLSVPAPVTSTSIPEESVVSLASSLVLAQREKEKRQLNIILHNLQESTAPEGLNR